MAKAIPAWLVVAVLLSMATLSANAQSVMGIWTVTYTDSNCTWENAIHTWFQGKTPESCEAYNVPCTYNCVTQHWYNVVCLAANLPPPTQDEFVRVTMCPIAGGTDVLSYMKTQTCVPDLYYNVFHASAYLYSCDSNNLYYQSCDLNCSSCGQKYARSFDVCNGMEYYGYTYSRCVGTPGPPFIPSNETTVVPEGHCLPSPVPLPIWVIPVIIGGVAFIVAAIGIAYVLCKLQWQMARLFPGRKVVHMEQPAPNPGYAQSYQPLVDKEDV